MHINWLALLVVASVTLVVAVAIVSLVAAGASWLDTAHIRAREGRSVVLLRIGAVAAFTIVGLAILFGLWLLIPYLH